MTWMPAVAIIVAFAFGLTIGSFLNVVIWRVPRGESIVSPPSSCPRCGVPIAPYDNVPILSWLVLRGKCRSCKEPISIRYPLVELTTGLIFAGVVAAGLLGLYSLALAPTLLYLASITVALGLIDLETQRLPNVIVVPSYIAIVALLAVASALTGDWWALLRALAGGAILFTAYFTLVMIYPRGMGFGDVKLAGVLGLVLGWIGWGAFAVGSFAAFLLGGLFGVTLLVLRRGGRKTAIPFGPWMLVGTWVGVVGGEPLWRAYLGLVGLA